MKRYLRSLTARMVLSHILVAVLTSIVATLALALAFAQSLANTTAADYRDLARFAALGYLYAVEDGKPNPEGVGYPPGFDLYVSVQDVVMFSFGDTPCRAGDLLDHCAPELAGSQPGERFFQRDGTRWAEVVVPTVVGTRVISRRGPVGRQPAIVFGENYIYGTIPFMLVFTGAMTAIAVPVSLVLAWLFARPQTRRLSRIATVSHHFASGDLSGRVRDTHKDEIGKLAQQFDDMADGLAQNIHALRDLAQRNAELAQQAEQAAIQAERVRISRDLHDAIAQRLFSLSVSTATLPDLIQTNQAQGIQQSRIIAGLAEQTLLDLRALLVDLRPVMLVQRGLAEALHTFCDEWQAAHAIPVECSLMLTGRHLPSTIEDTLYRITQEALSNVAKHAQAGSVHVSLVEGQKQIRLSISDSGTGFDVPTILGNGRFGLRTMSERTRAVGGTLTLESEPGRGTTVQAVLPLERTQEGDALATPTLLQTEHKQQEDTHS